MTFFCFLFQIHYWIYLGNLFFFIRYVHIYIFFVCELHFLRRSMLFTFCVSNKAPKVRISVLKSSQPCRDNILIAFLNRWDNLSMIFASINQDEKRIIENLSVLSFKWVSTGGGISQFWESTWWFDLIRWLDNFNLESSGWKNEETQYD